MQAVDLLGQNQLTPQEPRMAPSADAPLYRELAQTLRGRIVSGELAPGDLLPTELKLAEDHKVSRNTVRLALNALTSEGLVSAGRGRGGRRVRDGRRITFHGSKSE